MSTKTFSAIAFVLPFLCAGLSAPAALAESTPKAVRADPRIRIVAFQPDQVVAVYGMMGVSTMIEFNSDEHVLTIAMGDTVGWQAVPDSSSQFIYVKPLRVNAVTNLNVVTDKRIYNFILHGDPPGDTRRAVIKLRFSYPDDARDAKQLAALPPQAVAQLQSQRQSAALLLGLTHEALANASGRFAALQQLIDAIGGASDPKAALDLQARISAEAGMLQNEGTKLQVLFQTVHADEQADTQRTRELIIAGHGAFAGRFQPHP